MIAGTAAVSSIRSSTRIALAEALALPTGLLTAGLLTRKLGPSAYGVLAVVLTIATSIEWTLATLLARATVLLVADSENRVKSAEGFLRMHILIGLMAGLSVFFSAPAIARALTTPESEYPLRLASLEITLFLSCAGYRAALIGLGKFDTRAAAAAARWLTRLALIYVLVLSGFGLTGAVIGSAGGYAAELLALSHRQAEAIVGPVAE
ncbi:MAG: oligosaccharide flippase family protein [Bryobacteraceae bacterium]